MKTLVITDVQRDFFHPEGSLYVRGGESLPSRIAEAACSADSLIFTLDWHPSGHCSFRSQGGPWPEHCVNYTQGAGLADEFTPFLNRPGTMMFFKGTDLMKEQYGAFENLARDNAFRKVFESSDLVEICGIAGDYCVKETAKNLLGMVPSDRVVIRTDLICSIDDGSVLKRFITDMGLRTL